MEYQVIPATEAEEMYNQLLDEVYPVVSVCGYEFSPSQAIKVLDKIVYETGEMEYYDHLYKEGIAVEGYTDEDLIECLECAVYTDDARGNWCKDCDKQGLGYQNA
jgi:hypothetical protein